MPAGPSMTAGPSTSPTPAPARPSTAPLADPLSTVLNEMRMSEHCMEDRLKQLEEQMYKSQDEAVQKTAKKAK